MEAPKYLDLQNGQNNGPCTTYTLCFEIVGHCFGGPGMVYLDLPTSPNWNLLEPDYVFGMDALVIALIQR